MHASEMRGVLAVAGRQQHNVPANRTASTNAAWWLRRLRHRPQAPEAVGAGRRSHFEQKTVRFQNARNRKKKVENEQWVALCRGASTGMLQLPPPCL